MFAQPVRSTTNPAGLNKNTKESENFIPKTSLSRLSAGAGFGVTYFLGDVPMDAVYVAYGGYLKYSLSHLFGLRIQGAAGKLSGSPISVRDKLLNTWYVNNTATLSGQIIFNLGGIDFRNGISKNNLYAGTGLGLLFNDSRRDYPDAFGNILTRKVTEFAVPLIIGYKRKISNSFDIGIEASSVSSTTDKTDLYLANFISDIHGYGLITLTYNFTTKNRPYHMDWFNPVNKIYKRIDDSKKETIDLAKQDDDKDGIPNFMDQEPNTKPGYKVDSKGVTLDSDEDGIPDSEDMDPYGFNKALEKYFPEFGVQVKFESGIFQFSDSIPKTDFVTISATGTGLPVVSFPPNGFTLHVEQYPLLQQVARIMIADTSVYLVIIGHADNAREDITQITLAEKRALEVKRKLAKIYELEDNRMLVFSVKDPYIKKYNLGTEGLNRKVEFRIIRPVAKK